MPISGQLSVTVEASTAEMAIEQVLASKSVLDVKVVQSWEMHADKARAFEKLEPIAPPLSALILASEDQ